MAYTSTRQSAKSSAKYVYCMEQTKGYVPLNTSRLSRLQLRQTGVFLQLLLYIYLYRTRRRTARMARPANARTDTQTGGRTRRSTDGHAEAQTQTHGRRRRSTDADASARWCTDAKYSCVQCVGGKIVQTCPASGRTRKDLRDVLPYSAKFSRHIIFAFFADWSGTAKIRRREMRLTVKGVANKFP